MSSHRARKSRLQREWFYTAGLALTLLAILIFTRISLPLGNVLYDHFIRLQGFQASRNIVIVAIDDTALSELGGWPMKRSVYVDFLKQLDSSETRPKAIAFDLLFLDPSPDDKALAAQLKRLPSVLPLAFQRDEAQPLNLHATLPVQAIAESAVLGHINLTFDEDGVIRGFKPTEQTWPHLSLAMHGLGSSNPIRNEVRDTYRRFRMVDPRVGFPIVSLSQVLHDQGIASLLKDNYVLVGVTAPSLGDRYPTLYSGKNNASTPGVEILASILNASLQDSFVRMPSQGLIFLLSAAGLMLMLRGLVRLTPRQAIGLTLAVVTVSLLLSYATLIYANVWFDPTALILVALVLHPLWAWRRLEVLVYFLQDKAMGLNQLKSLTHAAQPIQGSKDVVLHYTRVLDQALEWAQAELQFLTAIVDEIPDAIAIFDSQDALLLCNRRMQKLFDASYLRLGVSLANMAINLKLPSTPDWKNNNAQDLFGLDTQLGVRDFYLKTSRIHLSDLRGDIGLLIWVDVTEIRQSQVQRDQTLQFLSHDMRTPLASILALTQTTANANGIDGRKIVQHANALLGMMDDFILSISAQAQQYKLSSVLLDHLINDAIEQVADLANAKQIRVVDDSETLDLFAQVQPRLMVRVLVNVLFNAIKFAPRQSTIHIKVTEKANESAPSRWIAIHICNQVDEEGSALEFTQALPSFGLGLNFVETVIKKHHGKITRHLPEKGNAEICIYLPF